MRELLCSLCYENFSRFHLQDEHKRFVNQYVRLGASTKPIAKIRIGNDFAKFIFVRIIHKNYCPQKKETSFRKVERTA